MIMITKFTILGERCSGTNFLENAIKTNFEIEYTKEFGHKHFFGFNSYKNSNDTLFIGIIRNPHEWANSLFKQPYHLAYNTVKNKHAFLNNNFCSMYPDKNRKKIKYRNIYNNKPLPVSKEILEDRNMHTKKRYKNIFECRETKAEYLLDVMPNKVKHYIFIRYEDLRDNYEGTLKRIKAQFNLKPSSKYITPITYYKSEKDKKYEKSTEYIIHNKSRRDL